MKLTLTFIFVFIAVVCIYDIIALIYQTIKGKKNKLGLVTITTIIRRWFGTDKDWKQKGRPIVPYAIGVLVGHFGLYKYNTYFAEKISIIIFISFSISMIVLQIVFALKKKKPKLYLALCRSWPISIFVGLFAGSFWQ